MTRNELGMGALILLVAISIYALFPTPMDYVAGRLCLFFPDCVSLWIADTYVAGAEGEVQAQIRKAEVLREQLRKIDESLAAHARFLREYRAALQGLDPSAQTAKVGSAMWPRDRLETELARLHMLIEAEEEVRGELTAHLAEVTAAHADATLRVKKIQGRRAHLERRVDANRRKADGVTAADTFFGSASP